MSKNKEEDITELNDYSEDETVIDPNAVGNTEIEIKKDNNYVGIHSSGFRDFVLKPELLRIINESGFEHPSEVQQQAIPHAILGMDVLCQAKSGMGKTAVFVISILQQEPESDVVSALILGHTRELAYQICSVFERFKKYFSNIRTGVFIGGTSIEENIKFIKEQKPNIVVGTPGRISQLGKAKNLDLKYVKHFVLDECDKMLDQLDMRKDVQDIYKMTPHTKQVMMFSATLPDTIRPVCRKFMHNPLEIYIDDGSKLTLHGLLQYFVNVSDEQKNTKIAQLLDTVDFSQCIIFVRSVQRCQALNRLLVDINFPAICIHSGMRQEERIDQYRKFRQAKGRILVSTNLFGRGIDIEKVNVVINYDMPDSSDTYLHRVGRAGRFGTKGLAVSFISSPDDRKVLEEVQNKFVVKITELPDEIDSSTYKGA